MSESPMEAASVDERYAALLRAIEKMPRHAGISFRGHHEPPERIYDGRAIVTQHLTPTSKALAIATAGGTVTSVFAIVGDGGAAIWELSQQPLEREVVFLPSTLFVMITTERVGPLDVTFVEQVNPERTPETRERLSLEWARTATAAALELANSQGMLVTPPEGKYVGPIE